jgi:hypothetical protein
MNASDEPARLRLAIVISIAAHACALWLLAVTLDDAFIAPSSDADNGAARFITTIEHRLRSAPVVGRHIRALRPPRTPAHVVERLAAVSPPPPRRPPKATGVFRGAISRNAGPPGRRPTVAQRPTLALVEPTEPPTPVPTAEPTAKEVPVTATASPTPQATRSPAAVVAASFGGLFSADYPPALAAQSDVAEIRALLHAPARIRIDVDETGQATGVRFVVPLSDPQIEQTVRDKLLALHYVPADCNGLHCEGTLELRL